LMCRIRQVQQIWKNWGIVIFWYISW
jgi:hypothetical protein